MLYSKLHIFFLHSSSPTELPQKDGNPSCPKMDGVCPSQKDGHLSCSGSVEDRESSSLDASNVESDTTHHSSRR